MPDGYHFCITQGNRLINCGRFFNGVNLENEIVKGTNEVAEIPVGKPSRENGDREPDIRQLFL